LSRHRPALFQAVVPDLPEPSLSPLTLVDQT
jgi:hypothetical protein